MQGHVSVQPWHAGLCGIVGLLLFPRNAALWRCHFGGGLAGWGRQRAWGTARGADEAQPQILLFER